MPTRSYKLTFTTTAKEDQKNFKRYILENFKYKKYGENFDAKMRSAYEMIKAVNKCIEPLKIRYRGYDVFLLPHESYLFFYIVDERSRLITVLRVMQDGMNWTSHILRWLKQTQ